MYEPCGGVLIVLTVAHLDHTPENCADENLAALCQRCHNRYDAPNRRRGVKERARELELALDLLPDEPVEVLRELDRKTREFLQAEGYELAAKASPAQT